MLNDRRSKEQLGLTHEQIANHLCIRHGKFSNQLLTCFYSGSVL